MSPTADELVRDAIEQLQEWERALQARSARAIRRTEREEKRQRCLAGGVQRPLIGAALHRAS